MKILNIEMVDFYSHSIKTATLTILNKDNKEMTIQVQTEDGLYREDLGCMIYPVSEASNCLLYGVLDKNDFSDYENDIKEIIRETEKFISSTYKIEVSELSIDYVFKIFEGKVALARVNPEFTDTGTSSNQPKYTGIKDFDTMKEAKDFLRAIC